jgi:hypothetical protein
MVWTGCRCNGKNQPIYVTLCPMEEPQQPARGGEVESEGDRRLANIVLVVILVILVGGGIWLANAMFEQRALDDCLAQGRRNCAPPIEAPTR